MLRLRPAGLASVSLLSASAVGLQITLMRLFSIMLWQNFAAMIISLTLLGYGASGTALAILGPRLGKNPWRSFGALAALFGLLVPPAYLLAAGLDFNPLQALWLPSQFLRLASVYLLLGVPFLMAGGAIGLALMSAPEHSGRIYASDLAGAGVGPAAAIVLMLVLPAETCLFMLAAGGLAAGALAFGESGSARGGLAVLALAVAIAAVGPRLAAEPVMSEYKDLPRTLNLPEARVLDESSGPLGLVNTADSPEIPLRFAPGLSVKSSAGPPAQIGVFLDGHMAGVIEAQEPWTGPDSAEAAYLERSITALPYLLSKNPRVFLADATGPGSPQAVQAFRLGASSVSYAAPNSSLARTALRRLAEQGTSARDYLSSRELHALETTARAALSQRGQRFDLVMAQRFLGPGAATAVSGEHLLTVQGIRAALDSLTSDGIICIATPVLTPPRATFKALSTVARVLVRSGRDPAKHLAVVRSWDAAVLMIRSEPLTARETRKILEFCDELSFDAVHVPNIAGEPGRQRHSLPGGILRKGVRSLVGGGSAFIEDYRFDIRPATDQRPFFDHYLKPGPMIELISKRGSGGLSLVQEDYPILIASVVQAACIGVLVILAPLLLMGTGGRGGAIPLRAAAYFLVLGLTFLALEMVFLNRFALVLGDPLLGAGLAVAVFLVFAGAGSRASGLLRSSPGKAGRAAALATIFIALSVVAAHLVLDRYAVSLLAQPLALRAFLLGALTAPAAFFMGMPFPLGLYLLGKSNRAAIAWSWGLNGWASVVSAALAQLLAVHLGFGWIVFGSALLYLLAGLALKP